jgi:hypothetical protein
MAMSMIGNAARRQRRAQKGLVVEAREDSLAKLPLSAAISV